MYRRAQTAHRDLAMIQGRRWLWLYPTSAARFIGGIFTYNWGSFHLACQKAQQRRRAPRGSYHFPYFLAPDKGIQAASLLKMMYFWSKSPELSAARPSAATWLLLDRFVPLIRADSDCRHCLCKEKTAEQKKKKNLPSAAWKPGWGKDFRSGICWFAQ